MTNTAEDEFSEGNVLWVANRNNSLSDTSGDLTTDSNGTFIFCSLSATINASATQYEFTSQASARFIGTFGGYIAKDRNSIRYGKCREYSREKMPDCMKNSVYFFPQFGQVNNEGIKPTESHNMTLFDCEAKCRRFCSCVACATTYENGTGFEIWGCGMKFKADGAYSRKVYILNSRNG